MKKVPVVITVAFIALLLGACETSNTAINCAKTRIKARVTYYSNTTCPYGAKVACPWVKRAQEGITVAASKKLFPFGTKIQIHGIKGITSQSNILEVQDRGSAVENAKASHKSTPVLDVYIQTNSRHEGIMREKYLASINPDYLEVDVFSRDDLQPQFKKFKIEED